MSPSAADRLLLEHAEELHLQRRAGSSPISSRNSVPPSASSKSPRAIGVGVGEGALLVAEELALQQVLGDGAAVDRDERAALARARAVERARDELLADAALAR